MIAEWILIYAVVFILCAVVVGHVPTKQIAARGARSHRLEHGAVAPRDEAAVTALAPGSLRLKR